MPLYVPTKQLNALNIRAANFSQRRALKVRGQKVQAMVGSCPTHQGLHFSPGPKLIFANVDGLGLHQEFVLDISMGSLQLTRLQIFQQFILHSLGCHNALGEQLFPLSYIRSRLLRLRQVPNCSKAILCLLARGRFSIIVFTKQQQKNPHLVISGAGHSE